MRKVISCGWGKTGTTSLQEAYRTLGYKTEGGDRVWWPEVDDGDIKNHADNYEALGDDIWRFRYKELDLLYPGSKFILTTRRHPVIPAISAWYRAHTTKLKGYVKGKHKRLPGLDGYSKPSRGWVIQVMLGVEKHQVNVMEHFKSRPNQLLVMCMDYDDRWGRLCNYLGKPIPNTPFPEKNRTKLIKKHNIDYEETIKKWLI